MGGRVFEEMQREVSLEDILQVDKTFPDQVIWIDIQAPDETVMKHMESKFCIHPLTVEDILSTGEFLFMYLAYNQITEKKLKYLTNMYWQC